MYHFGIIFFLPTINALIAVQIHRQALFHPNLACTFIRNTSLSNEASIQSCIWECEYVNDCHTAVFDHDKKICMMYGEVCTTGRIESSGSIRASVICYQKGHESMASCSLPSTPIEREEEKTSISHTTISTTDVPSTLHTSPISNITALNVNLVVNGDAESGSCATSTSTNMSPTKWNYNGTITQIFYSASGVGLLSSADPGPDDRGNCYFYGQSSPATSMWQIINLTNPVDHFPIDNHTIKFNLSAWIGGYLNQDDAASVSLIFMDQFNQTLSNRTTIGPVFSAARGSKSKLLFQSINGLLPVGVGTRFLKIFVEIIHKAATWNNGFVDNIALVLYQ